MKTEPSSASNSGAPPRTRRRLRKAGARKLVVICAGLGLGGVVAIGVESIGAHPQIASTVGAVVSAIVAGGDELWERREEPQSERVERLLRGDVYRNPLLIAFYTALGLFLAANLLALPLYITGVATVDLVVPASTQALYVEGVYDDEITRATAIGSVPLAVLYTVPIARAATYRIRSHALLWLTAATLVLYGAGFASWWLLDVADSAFLIALGIADLALSLLGLVAGWAWARRTRSTFVMSKLYGQLTRAEQADLIDLVRSLRDVPAR